MVVGKGSNGPEGQWYGSGTDRLIAVVGSCIRFELNLVILVDFGIGRIELVVGMCGG